MIYNPKNMNDYANMELTDSTSTMSNNKYKDWLTNEIMEFVRGAKNDEEAESNLKIIMEYYERRKLAWQLFKQFLKKLIDL